MKNEKRTNDYIHWNLPDICSIDVYDNGTVIVHRKQTCLTPPKSNFKRARIETLSSRARSRLAFVCKETTVEFKSMMTLTYPAVYPKNGKETKKHLNSLLSTVRARYDRLDYLWFLEFQRRGAPHFHIAVSVEVEKEDRLWLAGAWSEVSCKIGTDEDKFKSKAQHRRVKTWENIREKDGFARYATKYALKPYQKSVPSDYSDVGRFWGCSRNVTNSIPKPTEVNITENDLRQVLKSSDHKASKWDIVPKYIHGFNT